MDVQARQNPSSAGIFPATADEKTGHAEYIINPNEAPPGEKASPGINADRDKKDLSLSGKKCDKKRSVYALQVGAFRTKEAALILSKSLREKIAAKNVMICRQGDFFKVRITGFDNAEEVKSMLNAGFNGIIIKTGASACGESGQAFVSLPP